DDAAAAFRLHVRQGDLHADDAGLDVDRLHPLDLVEREVFEWLARIDRGVVDHDVEAANLTRDALELAAQPRVVAEVERFDTKAVESFGRLLERRDLFEVVVDGDDPGAGFQHQYGGLEPEATGGAGIENGLAGDRAKMVGARRIDAHARPAILRWLPEGCG